jgi:hypothetical protein
MYGFKWVIGRFFPNEAVPVGFKDNAGNFASVTLDASGNLPVNVKAGAAGGGALQAVTSGGCLSYHRISTADTNAVNVKNSPGQIYAVRVFNNANYTVYVKVFNKASAPIAGTDTPKETIGVIAGTNRDLLTDVGVIFSLGIGLTIVKGIADADATAVAANDCVVDVEYA